MAGFTALTEAHGDDNAADAAADFCARVREFAGTDLAVVKTIGDAVMCRSVSAAAAVEAGLRITDSFGGEHGALSVGVGMHTGSAVEREGDCAAARSTWLPSRIGTRDRCTRHGPRPGLPDDHRPGSRCGCARARRPQLSVLLAGVRRRLHG